MDDLSEINKKIDEYTGRANNFKRGLIWDDDPEIGDTIRITSIVTGLRFSDVIGPARDMGNYIMINRNFIYNKAAMARDEGISLFEDAGSQQIGFNNKSNVRTFKFDPDQKPALIVSRSESRAELENVPAIRRTQV
jgi:cell division protein FtsZ